MNLIQLQKMRSRIQPAAHHAKLYLHLHRGKKPSFSTSSHDKKAIPSWATLDPKSLGTTPSLHHVENIVSGYWNGKTKKKIEIPNPLNKDAPGICTVPDTLVNELEPFVDSMKGVSKSGVHNPLKNVERYLMYGDISRKVRSLH